MEAEIIKAPM